MRFRLAMAVTTLGILAACSKEPPSPGDKVPTGAQGPAGPDVPAAAGTTPASAQKDPAAAPAKPKVPSAPPRAVRRVALSVSCKTHHDNLPDVRKKIEERLAWAGIASLPEGSEEADAELQIVYQESQGAMYEAKGKGYHYATDIRLESVLTQGEECLLQLCTWSGVPKTLEGFDLAAACREVCFSSPHFMYLGEFAGTALGIEECQDRLAPACLLPGTRDAATRLLSSRGYTAKDPGVKAVMAAARDDFEECAACGSAALPVLLEIVTDPNSPVSRIEGACAALQTIGDTTVVPPLLLRITPQGYLTEWGPDAMRPILELIGVLGDTSALELMESLAKYADRAGFESRLTVYKEVYLEDLSPDERARVLDEAWPAFRRLGETARDAAAKIRSRTKK